LREASIRSRRLGFGGVLRDLHAEPREVVARRLRATLLGVHRVVRLDLRLAGLELLLQDVLDVLVGDEIATEVLRRARETGLLREHAVVRRSLREELRLVPAHGEDATEVLVVAHAIQDRSGLVLELRLELGARHDAIADLEDGLARTRGRRGIRRERAAARREA